MGAEGTSLEKIDLNQSNSIDSGELLTQVNKLDDKGIADLLDKLKNGLKSGKVTLSENEKNKVNSIIDKLSIGGNNKSQQSEEGESKEKDFDSLSDINKQKLTHSGITINEYEDFIEIYDYSLDDTIDNIIVFKTYGLLDFKLLGQIGETSKELDSNYTILNTNLKTVQNIKYFYDKGLDLSIIIKNIDIIKQNNLDLSPQQYFDFGNEILSGEIIDYLKVDSKIKTSDIKKMKLYGGVDLKTLQEVKTSNPEIFMFFKDIDVDKHYVVELAKTNFPIKDFIGSEKIFTKETIVDIVALHNRKNNISSEDIKFYFSSFKGKLDEVNNLSYYYIEKIDDLVGGDIKKVKPYIDKGLNLVDSYSKIKEDLNNTSYSTELGELKNINWLVDNGCDIKEVKKYLEFFKANNIKFDGKDIAFLIGNKIPKEGALLYLKNNKNLSGEDICFLVNGDIQAYDVGKYLKYNNDFTGKDIAFLSSNEILPTDISKYLDINNKFTGVDVAFLFGNKILPMDVSKYLEINSSFTGENIASLNKTEEYKSDFEKLKADFNKIKSNTTFNNDQIIELLVKKVDIDKIKDTFTNLKDKVTLDNICQILINGFTYSDYKKFREANPNIPDSLDISNYVTLRLKGLSDKNISTISNEYLDGTYLNGKVDLNQYKGNLNELKDMKNIGSLLDFLDINSDKKILIGKTEQKIGGNLQFIRGILDHVNNNLKLDVKDIDWNFVIDSYGDVLNGFVEVNKTVDKVYFLSSNHYYGEDSHAYQYKNIDRIKQIYTGAEILDFTTGTQKGDSLKESRDIIVILENDLKSNPGKNIMFSIALHGDIAGNAWTSKGDLIQKDFQKLNELSGKYHNLKIVIDSCNNWYKFGEQELKGNIISNSGKYYSVSDYGTISTNAFDIKEDGYAKGDFDEDGNITSQEVEMYTNINYQGGGVNNNALKSFYVDKELNKRSIDKQILS